MRLRTAGIDVGSGGIKIAVLEFDRIVENARDPVVPKVLALAQERIRRRNILEVIHEVYAEALKTAGCQASEVDFVATTGEGELVEFRHGHFFGMTAHARGALFLEPTARGVLDVGALHGRAIRMDDVARVLDYRMTSQCASGSGQFIENIARYLGVALCEVGPLSLKGQGAEKVSSICAVLAETDVINLVSRQISIENILRGIHESMAGRLVKLLRSIHVNGVVAVTGGMSADVGLLACVNELLAAEKMNQVQAKAHAHGIYAGALGAGIFGAYRHHKLVAMAGAA